MKDRDCPITRLINSLTDNEDYRQELWIHHLDGNPPSSLHDHLAKIIAQNYEPESLKESIYALLSSPLSREFTDVLEGFSEYEKGIMCLLVIGYDVREIAAYKGIAEVRIRQTIACIRGNPRWEGLPGKR